MVIELGFTSATCIQLHISMDSTLWPNWVYLTISALHLITSGFIPVILKLIKECQHLITISIQCITRNYCIPWNQIPLWHIEKNFICIIHLFCCSTANFAQEARALANSDWIGFRSSQLHLEKISLHHCCDHSTHTWISSRSNLSHWVLTFPATFRQVPFLPLHNF